MEVERYSHVLHLVSHVEGRLRPELDALDALRAVFPAGTLSRRPEGPRDAADRRGRGRAARAVRRRRRLPRLRRQPRHGDHHPQRRAADGPGPRPHRRRHRRRQRAREEFEETEHKAAAMRRAIELAAGVPERRAGGRRPTRAPTTRPADGAGARDPRHRQLRLLHVQPRAGARRPPARRSASCATTRSTAPASRRSPTTRRPTCAGSSSRPDRATPTTPACRSTPIEVAAEREIPLLGVCLGMQSMAAAFGASIVRAPTLVHGEASEVTHDGAGLLEGMPPSFMAARYHSLAVDPATLPPELRVTAMSEVDGVVMGIRHVALPLEGVQFHPESVLTPRGPAPARQLPAPGRGGRGGAPRRRSGSFATRAGDGRDGRRRGRCSERVRAAHGERSSSAGVDGRTLSMDDAHRRWASVMDGEATPAQLAALLMGAAHARRDGRRAGRVRDGDARARRPRRGARRARSTSSAPAATAAARSTSRRPPRWSWPRPACPSPSTATARSPRRPARPTCSRRSASGSTTTRRRRRRALRDVGFAFLFAPAFHPAMRHAGPTRREIGVRTAFNLLGPLTNPAGTRRQLLGVGRPGGGRADRRGRPAHSAPSARSWSTAPASTSCRSTGQRRALRRDRRRRRAAHRRRGRRSGCERRRPRSWPAATPPTNAAIIEARAARRARARRDVVLLNAGAALIVAGAVDTLEDGIERAALTIDAGLAAELLERLRARAARRRGGRERRDRGRRAPA